MTQCDRNVRLGFRQTQDEKKKKNPTLSKMVLIRFHNASDPPPLTRHFKICFRFQAFSHDTFLIKKTEED